MDISVIIPIYNVEQYLRRCIDSVLRQENVSQEIILVDDGSTDSSGKICDDYAANHSNIKSIHISNSGPSTAKNVGYDLATGNYVAFIDSDDEIKPEMFSTMLQSGYKHNADIVCCNYIQVDEEGNMFVFHRATHSKTSGGRSNWPYDNPLLKGGNEKLYIVKKEQRDKKTKFSSFELELKPNVDISYPEIKKFGSLLQLEECATNTSDSGNHHTNCRSRYESSEHIKPKEKYKSKKNKRDS